jgi:ketosteroid isomerase-like protein
MISWCASSSRRSATGDLDALRALLQSRRQLGSDGSDDPGAGLTEGRDAVIDKFLAPVRGLFEDGDPKVHVKRLFSSGGLVAAETEAIGTLRNGNAYHNRYAWIIEIKDDQVCHLREYLDTAYIMSVV